MSVIYQDVWNDSQIAAAATGVREREEQRKRKEAIDVILRDTRQKIDNYKFGDMLGPYEFTARNLDITDVPEANILLFGPTGAGKTSLIWMIEKMFGRQTTAVPHSGGGEGTVHLEPFLEGHEGKFTLLDSRGFFGTGKDFKDELQDILSGKIQRLDEIERDGDTDTNKGRCVTKSTAKINLCDQIHGLICVLDKDDPRFSTYKDQMKEYRVLFKKEGFSPVSVLTYKKKEIIPETVKKERTSAAAGALGAAIDRTFIVNNYVATEGSADDEGNATLLEILETALIGAELFVKIKKLEEKRGRKKGQKKGKASGLDSWLSELQIKYQWEDQDMKDLKVLFEKEDIGTLDALKDSWQDIKHEVRQWAIADLISQEVKRI